MKEKREILAHIHVFILLVHSSLSPLTHRAFVCFSSIRSVQYLFVPSRGSSHPRPTSHFFSCYMFGFFSDAPGNSAWFHLSRRDHGPRGGTCSFVSSLGLWQFLILQAVLSQAPIAKFPPGALDPSCCTYKPSGISGHYPHSAV